MRTWNQALLIFVAVLWTATAFCNLYLPYRIARTDGSVEQKEKQSTTCKLVVLAVRAAAFLGLLVYGGEKTFEGDGSVFALFATAMAGLTFAVNLVQKRLCRKKYGFWIDRPDPPQKSLILGLTAVSLLFFLIYPMVLL